MPILSFGKVSPFWSFLFFPIYKSLQAGGHHRGTGLHPGSAANPLPTVIPHNSANVESQLLCNYSQYLCRREKVNSHDYCSSHILEEKSAPYKPCNFQYARIHPHRKCPRPALKTDRKDGWVLTKSCQLLYLAKEGFRMEGTLNFDSLDIGANF